MFDGAVFLHEWKEALRGFGRSPPMTALTTGLAAAELSCSDNGAVSRLRATAVASILMWPISSVAVCNSISRYFVVGPRVTQA